MSDDNFYKAPDAELQVDNSDVDEFFTVSTKKFWIMHLLTFGLYDVYWFYRHWDHLKLKRGLSVSPGIRGVFFIFFVYSTFKEIQNAANARQLSDVPSLKLFALFYYLLFLGFLALTFFMAVTLVAVPWLSFALNIVNNVLTGFLFTSAQRTANRILDDERGEKNNRIGALNIVWIIVVLLFNAMSYLGSVATAP